MYHVNVTGMMNDRCVLLFFFRADRGRRSHVLVSDASRGQKRGRMKPDWGHCHQLPRIVRDSVTHCHRRNRGVRGLPNSRLPLGPDAGAAGHRGPDPTWPVHLRTLQQHLHALPEKCRQV